MRGSSLKYTVLHGKNKISIKEAAEIVEMSEPAVRNYVVNHGCKTIEEIKSRKNSPRARAGTPFKTYKTSKGNLTLIEIVEMHEDKGNVSVVTMRGRISRRGSACPSLWYPKLSNFDFRDRLIKDGLAETPDYTKKTKASDIAVSIKRKTCVLGGILCRHYRGCTDRVCFDKKMPKRYKKNKSCFEEKPLSFNHHLSELL